MKHTSVNDLRKQFLDFFERKDHKVIPSFSLVPKDDPSILLINAGMTPLKPYFTGAIKPPALRMASCQKCIRTPDIERVGITSRHGTYFEMLGNFSFGDYFKKEAIEWAWEFLTKELDINQDKLYVSVYEEDDQAYDIWLNDMGLPKNKIFRMGKEDNFWEHGLGPCGPCSEIYYDRGPDPNCGSKFCEVGCDCDRYIEVWNLVFTQFDKQPDGSYLPLEKKNIDTGMGLERLACVMQKVDNLFEVDTVRSILDQVCVLSGKKYHESHISDVSIRIVTDHIRSTVMMISDGILPSNEGRGYVLRRLIRRAARHGKLLGINEVFLADLSSLVINESKVAYPELVDKAEYIQNVLEMEEKRFHTTIEQGLMILDTYIEELKEQSKEVLEGEKVFKLHDTYGFPYELTKEIANEKGIQLDRDGFDQNMEKQKEMARKAHRNQSDAQAWTKDEHSFDDVSETLFLGYTQYENDATVVFVKNEGDDWYVVLDQTCFYAQSGGQISDIGWIQNDHMKIQVTDCIKTGHDMIIHKGQIQEGKIQVGDQVKATIDAERRKAIEKNHTATHMLQAALKNVLGDHIQQAGSYVSHERLRFDFSHFQALTSYEINKIQDMVNEKIQQDLKVDVQEMALEKAKEKGVIALFDEKYTEHVRVVSIDGYSSELCGGTHLTQTAQANLFKITSEAGVSAGVRRIEAITGKKAYEHYESLDVSLKAIADHVKAANIEQTQEKVKNLIKTLKDSKKEMEQLKNQTGQQGLSNLLEKGVLINDTYVVIQKTQDLKMDTLRTLIDKIREKHEDSIALLISVEKDDVHMAAGATKKAVKKGIHVGKIIKEVAKIVGGGGGGRPDMAQAGGKNPEKVEEALKRAKKEIEEVLLNG